MKKFVASSALVIALAVSANSASAADFDADQAIRGLVVSGVVESFSAIEMYGSESGDVDFDDDNYQFVSGMAGRLSLPLGENLSLQMDGAIEYSSTALTGSKQADLFASSFLMGGHVSWRNPDTGLFGGFASFGGGNADDAGSDGATRFDFYAVGGEAQFYMDNLTFYVQGGYIDGASEDTIDTIDSDAMRNAVFGRGVVRWFMTPDSSLQAEVAYVEGDVDFDDDDFTSADMSIVEWGVRYSTLISGVPVLGDSNVFVGYRGSHFEKDGPDDAEFTAHTVMVGFTHRFGTTSAQETDRYGATLDLPNFGRWVSAGEILE